MFSIAKVSCTATLSPRTSSSRINFYEGGVLFFAHSLENELLINFDQRTMGINFHNSEIIQKQ